MIIQSCRSDLMTVHLKQILAGPNSTGQDGTCENPPTVLIRISPPWFLSDRNCCSSQSVSESAREMPHRWFCQLCQVDFGWLDKNTPPKITCRQSFGDPVSERLQEPFFRATAGSPVSERLQGPFLVNGSKTIKTSLFHRIEIVLTSLGGFAFSFF